jgi:hypothetical protein
MNWLNFVSHDYARVHEFAVKAKVNWVFVHE